MIQSKQNATFDRLVFLANVNGVLTLSPPEGPYGPTVFIENCEVCRGKVFGILIALKGYAHCIYLLLTESLIMIPPGKRHSALGFPVKLNFSRA